MANMFNEDGTYNKTEWKAGDKITAVKLNKIESSLEAINNNDIDRHVEADSRLDILEERMANTPDNERIDALEDTVKDNKDAAELGDYKINSRMTFLENELNEGIEEVHNVASTVDGKIATMEAMVAEVEADLEGLHAKDEELSEQLGHIENTNTKIFISDFPRLVDENDDTERIKRALNEIKNTGGTLCFKNGIYEYTDIGNIGYSNISLIGEDVNKTILKCISTEDDHTALNIDGFKDTLNFKENIRIENLTVEGNENTQYLIFMQGLARAKLKNVSVREAKQGEHASTGFMFRGVMLSTFEHIYCSTNIKNMVNPPYIGLLLDQGTREGGNVGNCTNNTFINCYFEGVTIGVRIYLGDQNTFISCSPEKCGKYGFLINTPSKFNTIIGCGLESNVTCDIYDEALSTIIENCYTATEIILKGINTKIVGGVHNIISVWEVAKGCFVENVCVNGWGGNDDVSKCFINEGYSTKISNIYDRHNEVYLTNIFKRKAISVNSSPFTWSNDTNKECEVYVQNGELTQVLIHRDDGNILQTPTTPAVYTLQPNDAIEIKFTTAPTAVSYQEKNY